MKLPSFLRTSPLRKAADELANDSPWGATPGPESPDLPDRDARSHALAALRRFISLLEFQRTGGSSSGGRPIGFRLPIEDVHTYMPDDVEQIPRAPSIGILPGQAQHETYGLGPPQELEETKDRYGCGTLLVRRGDYNELVGLEVFANEQAERRALRAGLMTALRINQNSSALRLRCDGYFDRVASFALEESMQIDDEPVLSRRRRTIIYCRMSVQEVTLVRYRDLTVSFEHVVRRSDLA